MMGIFRKAPTIIMNAFFVFLAICVVVGAFFTILQRTGHDAWMVIK